MGHQLGRGGRAPTHSTLVPCQARLDLRRLPPARQIRPNLTVRSFLCRLFRRRGPPHWRSILKRTLSKPVRLFVLPRALRTLEWNMVSEIWKAYPLY